MNSEINVWASLYKNLSHKQLFSKYSYIYQQDMPS